MTTLLSRHSSNPLQAPSDDPLNQKYVKDLKPVLVKEKNRGDRDPSSVHNNVSEPDSELCFSDDTGGDILDAGCGDEDMNELEEEGPGDGEELDEEEQTFYMKDPQEQEQILGEITELEESVPQLRDDFRLIDRLGEGMLRQYHLSVSL